MTVEGLAVRAGRRTVLRDVSLCVGAGEIVSLVGPNGGGKSTLLRAVIGAAKPAAGRITRRAATRLGYMPQKMAVDRTLPLDAAGFLGLGAPRASAADRIAMLDRVDVAHSARTQLSDLSGGEMQRVLLARALLRDPDLLLLDEPTQGLDHRGAARFYRLIEEARRERGLAVLLVSHDLDVVMRASDRVICLNGHVCCAGAPDQVCAHPEYQRLFGPGAAGRSADQDADGEAVEDAMAIYRHRHDHEREDGSARAGAAAGTPVA
ncbi:MAG: ATP-binding cassette domain-containing protein [Pseudomonadota bacterium]